MTDLRKQLFDGITKGCSNRCVVHGQRGGMVTNGNCDCVVNMNRTQLRMLQGRLNTLLEQRTDESLDSKLLAEHCAALGLEMVEGDDWHENLVEHWRSLPDHIQAAINEATDRMKADAAMQEEGE